MPIKFDIEDGRVLPRAQDLLIREFKAIYDADKTKTKEQAAQHLAFVHLFCDLDGAFSDLDPEEKEKQVKANVYGDSDYQHTQKWIDLIDAANAAYVRYNETSEKRILATYNRLVDQIRKALDNIEIRIVDEIQEIPDPEDRGKTKKITLKANAETVIDISKNLDGVFATRAKILDRIQKKPESKNRGGQEESLLEQGKLGIKPINNVN